MILRFRSFQGRLFFFFLMLLLLLLGATHVAVDYFTKNIAEEVVTGNLQKGARIFDRLMDERVRQLTQSAWLLSGDYAFKQAYSTHDYPTVLSALLNQRDRIGADAMTLITLDGTVLADTLTGSVAQHPYLYPALLEVAAEKGGAHAFLVLEGKTYQTIVVPLAAPVPVAWITISFALDDKLCAELKSLSGLEVSFFVERKEGWRPIASTLKEKLPAPALLMPRAGNDDSGGIYRTSFAGDDWLTLGIRLGGPPGGAYAVTALLQNSLAAALAPYERLRLLFVLIGVAGIGVSAAIAMQLARSVSRPVQLLTGEVKEIAQGNFAARVSIGRQDEIGTLAQAVNDMAADLEEKEKMRSLLGVVVSPAVAEELLNRKLELGGEIREVTILFADIRSFTSHAEGLAPHKVVSFLNMYLGEMAGVIGRNGGVVDKFIGDAIMALFGAPAAHDDDADRALRTAIEMKAALRALNGALAQEGLPELTIGIGINSGDVLVGNMGAPDRLNYTVIGDAVNVAARLEKLTKEEKYHAQIIISDETLQRARGKYNTEPLGEVLVKGKNIPVRIHALKGM